jgi:predicted nucleic acid-binding protein
MDFVLDASIAMGWLLQSQASQLTNVAEEALLDGTAWVPDHFGIEVMRALRGHERRGLLAPSAVDEALTRLRHLPLKPDPERMLHRFADIVGLARRHGLRVADAAYLDMALRMNLPLATRDTALAQAAVAASASLFTR